MKWADKHPFLASLILLLALGLGAAYPPLGFAVLALGCVSVYAAEHGL